MHWRILNVQKLISILLCFDLNVADLTPAGKAYSFTFTTFNITQTFPITWYSYRYKSKIFRCIQNKVQCDTYTTSSYPEPCIANRTSNSTSYISTLTLLAVTPLEHNNRWLGQAEFDDNTFESTLYRLEVFAVPEIPTYDNVSLVNESNININCMTNKVFPGSNCTFYIKTNNSSPYELKSGQISYTHKRDDATGYYRTNCTYSTSANLIGPGIHTFNVVMHPDSTSNISEEMKSTSDYTTPIKIVYPKAVLAPDCDFTDYIKENETRTCTCYDDNTSFLLTQVRWSIDGSSNSTLTFTARRPSNDDQIFQCIISNILNWTNTITYRPIIAYPPNMNISLFSTEIDICDEKNVHILGNCSLSPSFPQPTVQVYINNVLLVGNPKPILNVYTFNSNMVSPGFFNVTCYANNQAFSVNVSKPLSIKGPTEIPAIYKFIEDDDSSPSESTRQAIIMCQSRGGYPYSKKISLTCGSVETEATNVDNVILQLNVINTSTDVTCTCVVWHESKCVKNITTEKLRLSQNVLDFLNDSSTIQVNIAAIGVGVTLAIVTILFILIIFVIIIRNKGSNWNQKGILKTSKNQEYSNPQADCQYVNNDMHAYETAKTRRSSYANEELPTTSINRGEKEEHPYYEIKELK